MNEEIKNIIEATSMGKLEKKAVIKSLLDLHNVVGRSEQLKAFRKWWNEDNMNVCTSITHKDIERYLESL